MYPDLAVHSYWRALCFPEKGETVSSRRVRYFSSRRCWSTWSHNMKTYHHLVCLSILPCYTVAYDNIPTPFQKLLYIATLSCMFMDDGCASPIQAIQLVAPSARFLVPPGSIHFVMPFVILIVNDVTETNRRPYRSRRAGAYDSFASLWRIWSCKTERQISIYDVHVYAHRWRLCFIQSGNTVCRARCEIFCPAQIDTFRHVNVNLDRQYWYRNFSSTGLISILQSVSMQTCHCLWYFWLFSGEIDHRNGGDALWFLLW